MRSFLTYNQPENYFFFLSNNIVKGKLFNFFFLTIILLKGYYDYTNKIRCPQAILFRSIRFSLQVFLIRFATFKGKKDVLNAARI